LKISGDVVAMFPITHFVRNQLQGSNNLALPCRHP